MTGDTLGPYPLLERLGAGGFAVVWRARHPTLHVDVALKVLKTHWQDESPEFRERFEREARAAAALRHPNIVTIHDLGEAAGQPYICMELVPGPSLDQHLAVNGPLSWADALQILEQLASALDFAHAQGMVHRDVKPGNVLLDPVRGAVLTDFGFVRLGEASISLSRSGEMLGTPAYSAPEVWDGKASPASDQYALACIAAEMLTGQRAFDAQTPMALMKQHASEGPKLPEAWPAGFPTGVTDVLRRGLAKDPFHRYSSTGEFVAALRARAADSPAAPRVAVIKMPEGRAREDAIDGATVPPSLVPDPGAIPPQPVQPQAGLASGPEQRPARSLRSFAQRLPRWAWIVLAVVLILLATAVALVVALNLGLSDSARQPPSTPTATEFPGGYTSERAKDGMTMVYVPSSKFSMGSSGQDAASAKDEKPQRSVALAGFWIDREEVSNAQYAMCMEAGVCRQPDTWNQPDFGDPGQPVVWVNWNDALVYCQWAGARLLTEAEWEKAARGTDERIYPWGDSEPDCDLANYSGCLGRPDSVDAHRAAAGPYGTLNMAGNVWEWCRSLYSAYPYKTEDGREDLEGRGTRVVRGGAWNSTAADIRTANRSAKDPDFSNYHLGFRCTTSEMPSP